MRGTLKSAARPGGARSRRVRLPVAVAEDAKLAESLAQVLCILLHIFFGGVLGPPLGPLQEGCAFRRAAPRGAQISTYYRSIFSSFFGLDF